MQVLKRKASCLAWVLCMEQFNSLGSKIHSSEQDEVHIRQGTRLFWPCYVDKPVPLLYSSHNSGSWLEAATVTATFRDLPFYHTALREIQRVKMTVLLVPDKLPFKCIL